MGINRNIVECKLIYASKNTIHVTGINRNIVECKFGRFRAVWLLRHCINRNIVECKLVIQSKLQLIPRVLIETLWNVNCSERM